MLPCIDAQHRNDVDAARGHFPLRAKRPMGADGVRNGHILQCLDPRKISRTPDLRLRIHISWLAAPMRSRIWGTRDVCREEGVAGLAVLLAFGLDEPHEAGAEHGVARGDEVATKGFD